MKRVFLAIWLAAPQFLARLTGKRQEADAADHAGMVMLGVIDVPSPVIGIVKEMIANPALLP